jgi:hypothetical protein
MKVRLHEKFTNEIFTGENIPIYGTWPDLPMDQLIPNSYTVSSVMALTLKNNLDLPVYLLKLDHKY